MVRSLGLEWVISSAGHPSAMQVEQTIVHADLRQEPQRTSRMMVGRRTLKSRAIARAESPFSRRRSASACWCSLSLDVPFADARNSSGQLNPSKAAFELTPLASATKLGCDGAQRTSRIAVVAAQDAYLARAPGPTIWWGHLIDALLYQEVT